MEKSQKSLACDYNIYQNRSKAKNKIWKEQAITLFPDIAKPWSTPKRPAWLFPNLSTPAVLSPSPGRPTPAQKAGSAAGRGTNSQIQANALQECWSENPPTPPPTPDSLNHSSFHPSPHPQIRWGFQTAAAALVASLPMEQRLGGASSPFTGAAAPRLSPLRPQPSSSRHCFCPEQIPPPQGPG